MLVFQNLVPLAALLSIAFASPIERSEGKPLEVRQSATTCGSTSYTAAQVRAAFNAGYNYYTADDTAGSSTYPHTYNNYEGFDFPVNGPYQEFPLLRSGVYTGGSPGADRVIFSTSGSYAGAITHTGASGNNFVGCSGTS
ncbi:guanyl-specific ribonuclease f1 [Neofusicoccum parvum]|uniref:ribonuclease T1 n=2 Tax=Neofusicoccum parvum TaxID=310453 RepID=R1H1L9_BOTPV|nr:putative extracellular guanyl-specific ribonuclease protein [Neofusicoccum parvum UCRNP2]GME24095.1 guanyl-specific ribonuclease f1 [Neofusicoccum parvum]GME50074.1 guanyl-specific ribonuclease f1 [Neofusicoccum parvum]